MAALTQLRASAGAAGPAGSEMRNGRRTAGLAGAIVFIIVSLPSRLTSLAAQLTLARPSWSIESDCWPWIVPGIARQMLLKLAAQNIGLMTDI